MIRFEDVTTSNPPRGQRLLVQTAGGAVYIARLATSGLWLDDHSLPVRQVTGWSAITVAEGETA